MDTRLLMLIFEVDALFPVDVKCPEIDARRVLGNQNIFSDLLTLLVQGVDVKCFVPYWPEVFPGAALATLLYLYPIPIISFLLVLPLLRKRFFPRLKMLLRLT